MKKSCLTAITFWVILLSTISVYSQKRKISLDDLYKKGVFYEKSVSGITSMNNGESYTFLEDDKRVVEYDYSSGKQLSVLFDPSSFHNNDLLRFENYTLSNNETKMFVITNVSTIYRHSFKATYYIYDIKQKTSEPLSESNQVMLATFSPDAQKVSYVRDNNIFIKNLTTKEEKQITFDGLYNSIINGAADWVYEEEFALITGMQWSPDSKKLAFYRFDESEVMQFNMTKFQNNLYPENYTFKYSKAGEKNSVVSIHVYNTESGKTFKMDVGGENNQYIARIKWTYSPDQLCIIRMNRLQNKMDFLTADANTGESKTFYTEENKYYLPEPTDNLVTFTEDGKNFIITSERNGYNHIYLYGMDGKLVKQLTDGTNEVIEIYGYDDKGKRIFFKGFDLSPLRTTIYSVKIEDLELAKLSPNSGSNNAEFSKNFKYFILSQSNSVSPTLVTVNKDKGKQIRVLEDNHTLKETLAYYDIPKKEFFSFKTSEGVDLNAYIIKPLNFNPSIKYPVMMTQYSGPGSISVKDEWDLSWDQYLASIGYIVVCVDGRGTGGKGEAFQKMTYGQLGYYESIDQIETAKYLKTLGYVDSSRIGIWGWSYGGYMSSLCLFKGADVFKMAIAVAPVTNWRYYDSVYTERFMGLPQDNALGYDKNSPINYVDKLKGKLLIVHGTGDDNVHMQNSIEMIEKLIQANKQFDMMFYPDKNHNIYGGNTTLHLYTMMSKYVKENL
ncbi:MAG: S9 family peptidase [Bacteroidales bacterium]|nr:S9 family peptidase [Bacteroidales bacterium]